MGRSVNYHSEAHRKLYINYEYPTDEDGNVIEDGGDDWLDFEDYIIETIKEVCQSIERCKKREWYGNEVSLIAENNLCTVWVSEYCGLVSISFVPKEESYYTGKNIESLSKHWIEQNFDKIRNKFISNKTQVLTKLGNFSNGEGVFELAK